MFAILRNYGVTCANAIIMFTIFSSLLWITPATLYVFGLYHAVDSNQSDTIQILWSLNLGIYVFGSVLAFLSILFKREKLWPIRMFYDGAVHFSIASLPALAGAYIVINDIVGIGITLGAIGSICLSNAAINGILQELIFRKIQKQTTEINELQSSKKTSSSRR